MLQQLHVLRLCLDLNIFFSATRADMRGMSGTTLQALAAAARTGTCSIAPTQLIISWGMLNRLRKVFIEKLPASPVVADMLIRALAGYATLGPEGLSPSLPLGGFHILPISDEEDQHVLETAIAGRAHVLVTGNFKDFKSKALEVVVNDRIAIHHAPDWSLLIVHPFEMWQWLQQGCLPTEDELRAQYNPH